MNSPLTKIKSPTPRSFLARTFPGIRRFILFFALIAILAVGLDWMISNGLKRISTTSFGAFNRVMSGQVNAQIVITGSSRALAHYDPQILQNITGKSSYNLGRNGSQTDMQVAYLKTYLKRNTQPEIVIHNLDLFSFLTTHELYDPAQYFPYLAESEIYQPLEKIDSSVWKLRFIPLYRYAVEDLRFTWMTGLKGFFGWNPREDHFLGYNPRDANWTDDFEQFKASHSEGVKFEIEPAGVRAVEDLIKTCQIKGIRVILVYSPEYFEMQLLEVNRREVFRRFQELSERFNVPFFDYSDSEISLHREYFQNSQHLNKRGAEEFSRDLAHRLKKSQ